MNLKDVKGYGKPKRRKKRLGCGPVKIGAGEQRELPGCSRGRGRGSGAGIMLINTRSQVQHGCHQQH